MTDRLKSFREQELLIEYSSLRQPSHLPAGIYVSLSGASVRVWDGLLFLRSGPYRGACFKFRLSFGPDYPEAPPELVFGSDVWHPLVARTGRCVLPRTGARSTVVETLYTLKAVFKEAGLRGLTADMALNRECFDTLTQARARFDDLAGQCARVSRSTSVLFHGDRDDSALRCLPQDEKLSYEDLMNGVRKYASAQRLI